VANVPIDTLLYKIAHFVWRAARNTLSAFPISRRIFFKQESIASSFGPDDYGYAWSVFGRHYERLRANGFAGAESILEIGPGRNLGTGLLWWAISGSSKAQPLICLWDVFPNAHIDPQKTWSQWAAGLLERMPETTPLHANSLGRLRLVAEGECVPNIEYIVCPLSELKKRLPFGKFDLVYSQAALEHCWKIRQTWTALVDLTARGGWHSHRIDLADHGRRDGNYIEMLEWSDLAYWLTMRFMPGAINRWRAGQHLSFVKGLGLDTVNAERETRESLPVPVSMLSRTFRKMPPDELRTTALDLIARL
jgi:hypothetical protein